MGNNQSVPEDYQSQQQQHHHHRTHSQAGTNKPSVSPTNAAQVQSQLQTPRKSTTSTPHSHSPSSSSRAPIIIPIASPVATSTTNTHAQAVVSSSPVLVTSHAKTSTSSAQDSSLDALSRTKQENVDMGATESRPVGASSITTLNPVDHDAKQTTSQPVDVPGQSQLLGNDTLDDTIISSSLTHPDYSLVANDYSRPPRLPLPIEEEVHSPGSPIITPQDLSTALATGQEGILPRRTSVLSSTTLDDEDIGDNEALEPSTVAATVPTKIEWTGGGEKIYVTGTFVNWERKFKLHPNADRTRFAAVLQLKPGTHHVKFLVDGDMITSEDLPTTVDYTNILVNYIEVVAQLPASATKPHTPAKPMPIPGAVQKDKSSASGTPDADKRGTPTQPTSQTPSKTRPVSTHAAKPAVPAKQKKPRPKYTNRLPEHLHDLDMYTSPEDERYQRANRVILQLPQPPSLPMFMSKSILNGTTPHKDDASVLIMPNHTVLNHLATSSIKMGVLATSGTTRYKRKFLTTIMYKSTSDDG